jgi:hypothetical protein
MSETGVWGGLGGFGDCVPGRTKDVRVNCWDDDKSNTVSTVDERVLKAYHDLQWAGGNDE